MEYLDDHVFELPNFLAHDVCDKWIADIEAEEFEPAVPSAFPIGAIFKTTALAVCSETLPSVGYPTFANPFKTGRDGRHRGDFCKVL
ncbi:MAG: hypothetical protein ABJN34_09100 [Litoreibacter sp.]|uniref:hypothetical protein n=1 Tax=Litoreibacter sp. TaxID=1969459 RepID=UPI00329750F7